MAKAKKTTDTPSSEAEAPKKKTAAKKPAAKKGAKKAAPASTGTPMVDTSFAAEAAARMLLGRAKIGDAPSANSDAEKESGSFRNMKESLTKPSGSAANVLGNTLGPSKSNLPVFDRKQAGHSQTSGNVNRINVPRRTGG